MPWGVAAAAVVGAVVASDSASKASDAQTNAANKASDELSSATSSAKDDLMTLFPSAQQSGQQGFQDAMNTFSASIPAQQQAYQGGNVAAQNQIIAGLPQIQNALFGNQVDLSQLQAYQAPQQNLSFLNQQLPSLQQQNSSGQSGNIYDLLRQVNAQGQPAQVETPLQNTQTIGNKTENVLKDIVTDDPVVQFHESAFENDPVVNGLKKLFSDKRLKENIKEVGELAGHKIYTWVWKDTEVTKSFAGDSGIGFIAQEVEKTLPEAVHTESNGYKKIDISVIFGEK